MNTITINIQKEFDALPESFISNTTINIISSYIEIMRIIKNSYIRILQNSEAHIVYPQGGGGPAIIVRDDALVTVRNCNIEAFDKSLIFAHGCSHIRASGDAIVHAYDTATVVASSFCEVHADNESIIYAYDETCVFAYQKATVYAGTFSSDEITVKVFSPTVKVTAKNNNKVIMAK